MDQHVLDFIGNSYNAIFLLSTIVSRSDGRLDSKYKDNYNAKAMIEQLPKLREMLRKAWEDTSFKDIRNLSALSRCRGIGQPSDVTIEILRNVDSENRVLYNSWR
jgi:hypothetical protein